MPRQIRRFPYFITAILIGINVLVFFWMSMHQIVFDAEYLYKCGAITSNCLLNGEWYRLLTAMFLHSDLQHLGNNMLMLAALGSIMESEQGRISFGITYLLGGICAGAFSVWEHLRQEVVMIGVGASGGVFAIVGALVFHVIVNKGRLGNFTGQRVAVFAVLALYQGFVMPNVDNYAHIGGFVAGFMIGALCWGLKKVMKKEG